MIWATFSSFPPLIGCPGEAYTNKKDFKSLKTSNTEIPVFIVNTIKMSQNSPWCVLNLAAILWRIKLHTERKHILKENRSGNVTISTLAVLTGQVLLTCLPIKKLRPGSMEESAGLICCCDAAVFSLPAHSKGITQHCLRNWVVSWMLLS